MKLADRDDITFDGTVYALSARAWSQMCDAHSCLFAEIEAGAHDASLRTWAASYAGRIMGYLNPSAQPTHNMLVPLRERTLLRFTATPNNKKLYPGEISTISELMATRYLETTGYLTDMSDNFPEDWCEKLDNMLIAILSKKSCFASETEDMLLDLLKDDAMDALSMNLLLCLEDRLNRMDLHEIMQDAEAPKPVFPALVLAHDNAVHH